jgi:hypothetical protein
MKRNAAAQDARESKNCLVNPPLFGKDDIHFL